MGNELGDRKLHVLFVLENYWPNVGGVEQLFKQLAENLDSQGHRVTIITTRLSRSHPAREDIGGIRVLRYRFYNRYLFTLLAVLPVSRHAKGCHLVHTTSYNAALPAYIGARLRGRKVVVTFHEVWASLWWQLPYMSRLGRWLHFLFEQLLLRLRFDRFVGVSESTSDSLRAAGVAPSRVETIYNGIDYRDFEADKSGPAVPRPFTYTYFGRLGVSKGLDILMEAARIFRHKHPDSLLQMVIPQTPAAFFDRIMRELEEKGLTGYVKLRHHLDFEQLKRELLASDCAVVPSLSEGFCFAAVESIALGVPVISSDKAALREVVSGRFVKLRELTPACLAAALERAKEGDWETSPVRKFDIADTVGSYIDLYHRLLCEGAGRG